MLHFATADRIIEAAYGYRNAKVLLSAVELGLFDALAAGPLEAAALRQRLGIAERGACDFFDAVVALGWIVRDPAGHYANAPESTRYLVRGRPDYIGGLLENLGTREYRLWGALTDALRTGRPQTGFAAERHFGTLYSDPDRLRRFVKGMTGASLAPARGIAARFPWHEYRTFVDVGTAEGCLPVEVALAHGHLSGEGFDLPELRPLFEEHVRARGLGHRLRFRAGDFFREVLPCADVVVLGRVLHNWDLAAKRMLLEKAHAALPAGGALIVYERLVDSERREAAGLLSSLNMLVMTAGGFDFTGAECVAWMTEAGFRDMRVERLDAAHTMIVGLK